MPNSFLEMLLIFLHLDDVDANLNRHSRTINTDLQMFLFIGVEDTLYFNILYLLYTI